MSFEVDRYSSAWAHIALCADLTWVAAAPDEFIRANQRLWTQHCRISQAFQETTEIPRLQDRNFSQRELTDNPTSSNNQEDVSCNGRISVKDVIPESRLAQYGNFYYDESRERCYANGYENSSSRGSNGHGSENNDVTECWMLPEVEYWFQKLMEEPGRAQAPRRRRHFRVLTADDFGRAAGPAEAALAARVRGVRALWGPERSPGPQRSPSPPTNSRKMRARRRQPRRLGLAPPLPYSLDASAPLVCDPACKFQFDPTRVDGQRPRLAIQAMIRNSRTVQTYRGTNVSRFTPAGRRCWPRGHPAPRDTRTTKETIRTEVKEEQEKKPEQVVEDEEKPSTSAPVDPGLSKRLYSTVLSAPSPIVINQAALRLSQKLLTPGLLKLNPKIVLPSNRMRPLENKFEELEKEALEQYKASDESIDTKFRELEKQALEQYSSSTSCSSGQSAGKPTTSPTIPEGGMAKFDKNVLINSQKLTKSDLKNLKTPPREKARRPCKLRAKTECVNTNSDSDSKGLRWTLHVVPKKRHLSMCVSDVSSDDDVKETGIERVKAQLSAHGGGDLNLKKVIKNT